MTKADLGEKSGKNNKKPPEGGFKLLAEDVA